MSEFCENKNFPERSSTSSSRKCICWGGRTAGKGYGCISKEKLIYIFFLLGSSSIVILESGARAARGADFLRRPKSCFFFSVSRACDVERVQLQNLRPYSKTELKNSFFWPRSDRIEFSIDFINEMTRSEKSRVI